MYAWWRWRWRWWWGIVVSASAARKHYISAIPARKSWGILIGRHARSENVHARTKTGIAPMAQGSSIWPNKYNKYKRSGQLDLIKTNKWHLNKVGHGEMRGRLTYEAA